MEPLLQLRGVSKYFGPVQALTRVDLDVMTGQVTALAGDNGAGKSVLVKTISGLWERPKVSCSGGEPIHLHSRGRGDDGDHTIYQDLALCNNLDIVQNMYLGHELMRHLVLDEGAMEKAARQTLTDLSVKTIRSIRQPVESLSGGQRSRWRWPRP